jgi:hypothetical protein
MEKTKMFTRGVENYDPEKKEDLEPYNPCKEQDK